jgi:renal tumor antigen
LSSHLKYNFPTREGTGIREMITHASPDCVDLIEKLIAYNPEERYGGAVLNFVLWMLLF